MTDWDNNQPIYLQLRQVVAQQIVTGALPEGDAVPSVRQVATDERINPLTVSRAYQLLVEDGLLEKRRGLGMFVTSGAKTSALTLERERFLNDEWPAVLARTKELGLNARTLLKGDNS